MPITFKDIFLRRNPAKINAERPTDEAIRLESKFVAPPKSKAPLKLIILNVNFNQKPNQKNIAIKVSKKIGVLKNPIYKSKLEIRVKIK